MHPGQVREAFERMAKVVDAQNAGDLSTTDGGIRRASPGRLLSNWSSKAQPANGYTEHILTAPPRAEIQGA